MLDTRFPRPRGDIGCPDTFSMPVRRVVVPGAWPQAVVTDPDALRASTLPQAFTKVLCALEAEGARAVTTSCGFLVLLQAQLQARLRVPLLSSALLLLPQLLRGAPRVGVLTISAQQLSAAHLLAAGVPPDRLGDVVVQGLPAGGAFAGPILGNLPAMDMGAAGLEVVAAALQLQRRAPDLCSVVLECTNLPPHAHAIRAATGLQTFSLIEPLHALFGAPVGH